MSRIYQAGNKHHVLDEIVLGQQYYYVGKIYQEHCVVVVEIKEDIVRCKLISQRHKNTTRKLMVSNEEMNVFKSMFVGNYKLGSKQWKGGKLVI